MAFHVSESQGIGIVLIGIIIVGGISIVGWVLPTQVNNRSAIASCTITSGSSCIITIPFSPKLKDVNSFKYLLLFNPVGTGQFYISNLFTQEYTIMSSISTGQTWLNMPVAQTEIFGDTNHEIAFNQQFSGSNSTTIVYIVNAVLWANVQTCSNSATSRLRPQVSTDLGSTWFNLALSTGSLDLDISFAGNDLCGLVPVISSHLDTPASINFLHLLSTGTTLRVVGVNGSGIGDSPVFTEIGLTVHVNVNTALICLHNLNTLTTSQATVIIRCNGIVTSFTPSIQWSAI